MRLRLKPKGEALNRLASIRRSKLRRIGPEINRILEELAGGGARMIEGDSLSHATL